MNYSDWLKELENEKRVHASFREKAQKVEKRYRLEENSKFNVLWSNVEIQHASLYSATPKPHASRRYKDANPVAKLAAEVLQRALDYSIDQYDFDGVVNPAINNWLVAGVGQVKVIYDVAFQDAEPQRVPLSTFSDGEKTEYLDGDKRIKSGKVSIDEQGPFLMRSPGEVIARQDVWTRVVPWRRFHWSPAKDYDGVWWQGEELYLTEDQVRESYDVTENEIIPCGYADDEDKKGKEGKLAKCIEIWDRRHRIRFGIIEGMDRILKYKSGDETSPDDPYGLQQFWPYPKPFMANATAGNWSPVPDYLYYQDQALELERITKRIDALTNQLRWRGVSDATFKELQTIADAPDGKFIAVENYGERFGQKGLEAILAAMPMDDLVATLQFLHQARDRIKQTIFEITGLSDIIRGATDPNETLGAQQMKGQFANLRINRRQKDVQRFVRDIMRIKAEIIAEHFEPEQLSLMTGKQVTPEVHQMLRSDVLRNFAVDIETDSTVMGDQQQEQQSRTEAVQAVTQLVTSWAPLIPAAPQIMPILQETVLFLLRGFKAGSGLEEVFEKLSDNTAPESPAMGPGQAGGLPAPGNNVSPIGRR